MESVIALYVIAALIGGIVSIGLPILVVVMIIKGSRKSAPPPQATFDLQMAELIRLLQSLPSAGQGNGPLPPGGLNTQFLNHYSRAQRELDQMDSLRREAAELRMADLKSQAAQHGLYL
jgi:hypothetical protein